jgi:hypothetical protein
MGMERNCREVRKKIWQKNRKGQKHDSEFQSAALIGYSGLSGAHSISLVQYTHE